MIYIKLITAVIFSFSLIFNTTDSQAIKECFDSYKESILNQNGKAAVEKVDSYTLAYYDRILTLSLKGQETEVRNLSVIDKTIVLIIRHRVESQILKQMNAESLFIYAVNNGWVGKNSVLDLELGKVTVSNKVAKGEIIAKGNPSSLYFRFNKENEKWLIDLTSIMPASNIAFRQLIDSKNLDDDEFVINMIESVSGKRVTENIWQPLMKEDK